MTTDSAMPNILLITSDQQHWNTLGTDNPLIKTPALDRLCAEGTRFGRAYCPNPTCTPTRASIITGMYPSQHGAWTLGTKLMESVPTVGELFQKAGYATSLVGKAHFQPLASTPQFPSLECFPTLRDLDFWRKFHGPWYGFEHVETARMHGDAPQVGQHYAIWMEEKGLKNWRDYFGPYPTDGVNFQKKHRPYFNPDNCAWKLPQELHYTTWTAERTIAQIDQAAQNKKPFFCWSSFHDPHPPYIVPEPWASMYQPADMPIGRLVPGEHDRNPPHFRLTQLERAAAHEAFRKTYNDKHWAIGFHTHVHEEAQMRKDMACYYGQISFMDQQIGRILRRLDELGQAANTLVVFSTDHGHFLGQHGLNTKGAFHYEDMIRVPFIVRWPAAVPAGVKSEAIQNLVDLAPTFLAARASGNPGAGAALPGVMTGVNQLETWKGGQAARTWSITENHHTPSNIHLRTYVNQRWKITVYRTGDAGELFDLESDPGEVNNLWNEPSAAGMKNQLMYEFMQATLTCEPMPMPRIAGA